MKIAWWKKENTPAHVVSVFYPYRLYSDRFYTILGPYGETLEEALNKCTEHHTHILEIRSDMKMVWHKIHGRTSVVKAVEVEVEPT